MTWTASSLNGGSAISKYILHYTVGGGAEKKIDTGSDTTEYTWSTLETDKEYEVWVKGMNADHQKSPDSDKVKFTVAAANTPPPFS